MSNTYSNSGDPSGRLQSRQVEMILSQLDSLPTLPEVATQLLHLTASNSTHAKEVIELISADQSLTARILSLASRVDTGIRREARTISKAVLLLGFETIRSIVMSIKVFEMFEPEEGLIEGLDRREFWKHCVAVACAAELLATRSKSGLDPEEMFVCGLLHDVGKLALEQCLPKSYTRIVQTCDSQCGNIANFERDLIGVDHTMAGRRLAQIWDLPTIVENVIWLHHQDPVTLPQDIEGAEAIAIVNLADTIAREHRFGYSGNYTFAADSMELANHLGISGAALGDTIDKLPSTIEKRAQIMGLGETTSETLFRSALANANAELGRINRKYQARALQATASVRSVKHLINFSKSLSGRDTVSRACSLMAASWLSACNQDGDKNMFAGAYILSRRDNTAIMAMANHDGIKLDLVQTDENLSAIRPPENGLIAKQAFESFCERGAKIPSWLEDECVIHRPLINGSVWVGGLLWPEALAQMDIAPEGVDALATTMAFAAAATEMRDRGQAVAEQLATASQKMYQMQKSLAESRTLAVVGEMATGAAHEINNPLTVISGRAQLMAAKAEGNESAQWQNISDQAQLISDIVSDLMEFAQPPKAKPEQVSLSELISQAVANYKDQDDCPKVKINVNVDPQDISIHADPAQIASVLTELLVNAGRAIGAGAKEENADSGDVNTDGVITVSASPNSNDAAVIVKVSDNGCGMDTKILDQAFTPFFSARKAGRHRGMGLSRAKRFVEIAGGAVWIKSVPDEGTTVYLKLPSGPVTAE